MVPDHRLRGTTLTAAIAAGFVLGWVESLAVLASAGPLFAGVAFCFRACLIDAVMLLAAGATLQGCFELARRTRPGSSRERAWARRFSWLLGAGLFFATAFYLLEIYPTGHENKWSSRTLLLLAVSLVGCVLLAAGLEGVLGRLLGSRDGREPRLARIVPSGLVLPLALTVLLTSYALAHGVAQASEDRLIDARAIRGNTAPTVVLIVMDAARADHLSCYGYRTPTSPFIDSLAARGVLFRSAVAASSWSVPSHASIFTGLYPSAHGDSSAFSALDDTVPTLAQLLSQNGYYSISIFNNRWLGGAGELSRGFDRAVGVEQYHKTTVAVERVVARLFHRPALAVKILEMAARSVAHCSERGVPCFVFVNLLETHAPYLPREPYFSQFAGNANLGGANRRRVERLLAAPTRTAGNELLKGCTAADLGYLTALYDSNIRFLDDQIHRFFSELEAGGHSDNVIVSITANHGDSLGEHSILGHGTEKFVRHRDQGAVDPLRPGQARAQGRGEHGLSRRLPSDHDGHGGPLA